MAEHLEALAESPSSHTEPAKFPYPPNRLMANFGLFDATGRRWGFTVTLCRTADEEGVYILTINLGTYIVNCEFMERFTAIARRARRSKVPGNIAFIPLWRGWHGSMLTGRTANYR